MTPAEKRSSTNSETGQIPRQLMEAYREAEAMLRESSEEEDSMSITGVFKMRKRAEGSDTAKDNDDLATGSAPAPASG